MDNTICMIETALPFSNSFVHLLGAMLLSILGNIAKIDAFWYLQTANLDYRNSFTVFKLFCTLIGGNFVV